MICPECQASNPDTAEACSRCRHPLSDSEKTLGLEGAAPSEMPTMAGPTSLKEWVKGLPGGASGASLVLPEGLEIGPALPRAPAARVGCMGPSSSSRQELDRDVVLKLILSDISVIPRPRAVQARDPSLERVTHRNVLRATTSRIEASFLTMQFLRERTVASVLRDTGSCPSLPTSASSILEGLGRHTSSASPRDLSRELMVDAADRST